MRSGCEESLLVRPIKFFLSPFLRLYGLIHGDLPDRVIASVLQSIRCGTRTTLHHGIFSQIRCSSGRPWDHSLFHHLSQVQTLISLRDRPVVIKFLQVLFSDTR